MILLFLAFSAAAVLIGVPEEAAFYALGLPVTWFSIALVVCLLFGIGMVIYACKRHHMHPDTADWFCLLALPMGLIGARLFYCVVRLTLYQEIGMEKMLVFTDGGYAIWGAVGGVVLAAVCTARITKQRAMQVLDALTVPAAMTICLYRLAERLSGQGLGDPIDDEALCFFPLGTYYEPADEWNYSIFLLHAAVLLGIALFLYFRSFHREGDKIKAFFILYCCSQILLESLRRDEYLRWLFVRVSQLTAAIVLTLMMLYAAGKMLQSAQDKKRTLVRSLLPRFGILILLVGVCVLMEFAVEKTEWPDWLPYLIMLVCCVGIGVTAGQVIFPKNQQQLT